MYAASASIHVPCPLCQKDDAQPLTVAIDWLSGDREAFSIVRCRHCGLRYTNPQPTLDRLGQYYPDHMVSYQMGYRPYPMQWKQLLVHVVLSSIMSGRERVVVRALQRSGLLPLRRPDALPLRLLDVGCGRGAFLQWIRNRHPWRLEGCDFDSKSVATCRELGLRVYGGGLGEGVSREREYDVITMFHYLEHDPSPRETLKMARDLLSPGGLLILEVPNAGSLENLVFRGRSFLWDPPRHLVHWDQPRLRKLLIEQGYDVKWMRCCAGGGGWLGSVQQVFLGGQMYDNFQNNILGIVSLSALLLPLDALTALTPWGSVLRVIASKTVR